MEIIKSCVCNDIVKNTAAHITGTENECRFWMKKKLQRYRLDVQSFNIS